MEKAREQPLPKQPARFAFGLARMKAIKPSSLQLQFEKLQLCRIGRLYRLYLQRLDR
jgi:hypothetical protein